MQLTRRWQGSGRRVVGDFFTHWRCQQSNAEDQINDLPSTAIPSSHWSCDPYSSLPSSALPSNKESLYSTHQCKCCSMYVPIYFITLRGTCNNKTEQNSTKIPIVCTRNILLRFNEHLDCPRLAGGKQILPLLGSYYTRHVYRLWGLRGNYTWIWTASASDLGTYSVLSLHTDDPNKWIPD